MTPCVASIGLLVFDGPLLVVRHNVTIVCVLLILLLLESN